MDYSALTSQLDTAALKAYKQSAAVKQQWADVYLIFGIISGIVTLFFIFFFATVVRDEGHGAGIVASFGLLLVFAPLAIAFFIFRNYKSKKIVRHFRLRKFGEGNKLTVHTNVKGNSNYPGMIFHIGHSAMLDEQISSMDSTYVIGNYTYTTGSGRSRQTHWKGFMMLQLPRKLPHMVLDGKKNNTRIFGMELSNLPTVFKKEQTLALEGDFNEHFTLYAPKEYERDALYVFTPDLMALLIDSVAQYDAEVVDDKLFIYGVGTFNLLDQTVWERLLRIKDVVGAKVISQTDRYADERVGDREKNEIALSGKRLKQGVSVVGIVFFILYIVFMFLDVFGH